VWVRILVALEGRGPYPAPVRVYLCRHAKAGGGEPDELRALTAEGQDQARRLAEQLASDPAPPTLVLSSPLLRARQTAEAIARAAGAELRVDARLSPGATAESLREAVAACGTPVATVGHQPDCSEIALALTGKDPGFPPAGMVAIDLAP
jgi:phosphohistidine phosphatase